MNAQWNNFGIRPPASESHTNWLFDPPDDVPGHSSHRGYGKSPDDARQTAVNTLNLAGGSYLAPWLRAMQLSQGLGLRVVDDFWWSDEPVDC